jgi:hypothetical protein
LADCDRILGPGGGDHPEPVGNLFQLDEQAGIQPRVLSTYGRSGTWWALATGIQSHDICHGCQPLGGRRSHSTNPFPCRSFVEPKSRPLTLVLLGAQQREGVLDALVEDVIRELPVGQDAGELQGADH